MSQNVNIHSSNAPSVTDTMLPNRYCFLRKFGKFILIAAATIAALAGGNKLPAIFSPEESTPATPSATSESAAIAEKNVSREITPAEQTDDMEKLALEASLNLAMTRQAQPGEGRLKSQEVPNRRGVQDSGSRKGLPRESVRSLRFRKRQIRDNDPAPRVYGSSVAAASTVKFSDFKDGTRVVQFTDGTIRLTHPGRRDPSPTGWSR